MKNNAKAVLTCLDNVVSGEKFDLILDENLEMLVTSPKPKGEDLGRYYESEDYISHTDSNKSLMDKVYQIVKSYTIKKKVKMINGLNPNHKKILDIGCGTGDFLEACLVDGWHISGIEPNASARKLAIHKTSSTIVSDLKEVANGASKFDIITMWHVLEHVPNLEEYIIMLQELLTTNGTLIIAVPNYKSNDAKYYGKFWAAYDVPRHLWHFSQKSIQLLFSKVDLTVVKTLPMKFDAFYVSLLSEKCKSGKSNPFKAFYRGLVSNIKAKQNMEYSSLIYILKNSK